jgi:hypothetical protein
LRRGGKFCEECLRLERFRSRAESKVVVESGAATTPRCVVTADVDGGTAVGASGCGNSL